ncbi:hypothetical protein [Mucilaginibacter arboris]|uniref:Glycosyltransferase RgtA/B/C/D-like domain-containing protein n=1 Tax=Mucilaginibacter arboris TaxID=2682090 RepID=A0A7K1T1J1_9SPHI|nr:hypothetical protein [Mucilaginibacter arboris]MVN23435.1 hypothetical protein [Mucilaginibacter arboris]
MVNVNRARTERLLWTAIVATLVIASVSCLSASVSTFPDSGWGFLTWKNMQHGGAFNLLPEPDPDNIAENTYTFLTWWSPGQYLVPGGIAVFTGLKIGWAMAISAIIFTISGVIGCYFLFDKLRFNRLTTLISLLVLCCQVQTLLPFSVYNGGEVLIFGVAPWFWFCCIDFKLKPFRLLLLVLLSWIGFIAKSSFLLVTLCGFLFIFLGWVSKRISLKELAVKTSVLIAAGLAVIVPIFFLFLQKGNNPSAAASGFSFSWLNLLYPAAVPLLTAFSADEVFNNFTHPGFIETLPATDVWFYGPAFLLVVFVLFAVYFNRIGSVAYRRLLFSAYLFFTFFFLMQYCRHAAISMEGRHFRILGLLFLPGVVQLMRQVKISAVKTALQVLLLALCLFSWNDYFKRWNINRKQTPTNAHVVQLLLDKEALVKIHQLDTQYPQQALFVLMSPDIALEIEHNRALVMSFNTLLTDPERETYAGRVKKLFLLVPVQYTTGKTEQLIKASFTGYKSFSEEKISKHYVLYTGL